MLKRPCRIPEASWLGFSIASLDPETISLIKLGRSVSPLDVVPDGNKTLHAVEQVEGLSFSLKPLDSALVAPGEPSLVSFDGKHDPDLGKGVYFNLHNNVWGTNFPLWIEDDAQFRFEFKLR